MKRTSSNNLLVYSAVQAKIRSLQGDLAYWQNFAEDVLGHMLPELETKLEHPTETPESLFTEEEFETFPESMPFSQH